MSCRQSLVVIALLLVSSPIAAQQDNLQQALALQKVMHQVIEEVEPSIACILVSRTEAYRKQGFAVQPDKPGRLGSFDPDWLEKKPNWNPRERYEWKKRLDMSHPRYVPQSFGSGVAIDRNGLILTNYHVVKGATKIFVRMPGNVASYADVIAGDPRSDLAVLKLLDSSVLLKPVRLGDADKARRGHFVLSIANPYAAGFRDGRPSASWGIISNIRRRAPGLSKEIEQTKALHHYGTLIQTDARLNLGCSGGALINLKGEMIGLTTAMAAIHGGETPGGFALPIDQNMTRIISILKKGEEVDYGFLGVAFTEEDNVNGDGIRLASVTRGSPAHLQARLRDGDVLLAVNGEAIRHSDDLFLLLGTQLAGNTVQLTFQRPGQRPTTVAVRLAKFYVPEKAVRSSLGKRPFFRGLRVDYSSLAVQKPPRDLQIRKGVMITEIQPNSSADAARLRVGEIISHVNGNEVTEPAEFYDVVANRIGAVELTIPGASSLEPAAKVILD